MFERLDAEVRAELAVAYAPRSAGPLGSALRSLARFARRVPSRTLFVLPEIRGDLAVEAHNEWTLLLWAQGEARVKSTKTGRFLKAKSIETRISLAKGFLSHRYGFAIAGEAPRLKSFLARLRARDPLGATRKKRRGIRQRHFKRLWQRNEQLRGAGVRERTEWAAATAAWHVLARGGELADVEVGDLQFSSARGRRLATIWIRPLKKKRGQQQPKLPQYVAAQESEGDWQPYAALRRLHEMRAPAGEHAPLFPGNGGKGVSTAQFRALMKRYAAMLGSDPKEFGAHSARIGGAIDVTASGECSELLLEAKGRWGSDIAKIYARQTRRMHVAASDMMFRARGRDLEELLPGFCEPGR